MTQQFLQLYNYYYGVWRILDKEIETPMGWVMMFIGGTVSGVALGQAWNEGSTFYKY